MADIAGSQGWETIESTYPLLTLVNDPSAPGSASSVAHYRFPTSVFTGGGPASMRYSTIPNKSARTIYVATWVKYSPNWVGGAKMFYLWWTGGSMIMFMGQNPSSPDNLSLYLSPNHTNMQIANIYSSKGLQRGQWHLIEALLTFSSTSSAADGKAKVWVDGVVGIDRSNVALSGGPPFTEVRYSTIYHGLGSVNVPADQWMEFDNVVIGGK